MAAFGDVNSTADAFGILEDVYNKHNRREKVDFDYEELFVDDQKYYNDNGYFVENEPYNDNGFLVF